ncbi:MAG: hypothetical protein ACO32J_04610 [Phycisphaerales bacterium]|jgi:predicted transglutaminase-like cysteine proteinase
MHPTLSISMAILWIASAALATDGSPQRRAFERSTLDLEGLVAQARQGRITAGQLRDRRRRLEARLDRELSLTPVELKPGDLQEVAAARAEMNQAVIHSQEFEFFGSEDRPEWGWYPSRRVPSTGSTLQVDDRGRSRYNVLR